MTSSPQKPPGLPDHRRSETRCQVQAYRDVPGQFVMGTAGDPVVLPCTLADLSPRGCSVQIGSVPRIEPRIANIRFELETDLHIETAAQIRWIRQASIGQRTYGLEFLQPLTNQLVEQWIERGIVSRRTADRHPVELSIQFRRSGGGGLLIDATIVDYSATGFRMLCDSPPAVDQRMMVTLPDGRAVVASVVWTASGSNRLPHDRCQVGCSFANLISGNNVIEYFQNQTPIAPQKKIGVMTRMRRLVRR